MIQYAYLLLVIIINVNCAEHCPKISCGVLEDSICGKMTYIEKTNERIIKCHECDKDKKCDIDDNHFMDSSNLTWNCINKNESLHTRVR